MHLENVAKLCENNAVEDFKPYARCIGLLHDAGKYTVEFQKYIRGESNAKTEHARYGAQILNGLRFLYIYMMQYCIAGHHTGLPDGGSINGNPEDSQLRSILKREMEPIDGFYDEIKYDLPEDNMRELLKLNGHSNLGDLIEAYAFITRYMFSCLTDADYIDTEHFCNSNAERGLHGDFKQAYERICDKISSFKPVTELQKARGKIQNMVYESINDRADMYIVDMPTGSGKTLCSMKAALQLAMKYDKKRIIYVIPFVSIIEQTAKVFENIFGDALPVLQHHSNYDFENETDDLPDKTTEKLKRTCENWDADLIVTTNIQFFESLYHYRGSRLRKLHNLADSVIVFDEIHTLPSEYLQPCLRGINHIVKYLNSKAIIMSATMPDYGNFINKYMKDCNTEISVKDKSLYSKFKKCTYKYIGKTDFESIVKNLADKQDAMVIVNSRKKARELYRIFKDVYDGKVYHLSTFMTPLDRSETIAEINQNLKNNIKTILVSTSLIEAGVDLDFSNVYREITGLDSILQAGGRCNREGRLNNAEVIVFETNTIEKSIRMKANITKSLFNEYSDISDYRCIEDYYNRLFKYKENKIEENSISNEKRMPEKNPMAIPFRTYAQEFKFIDVERIGIVIPCNENEELINQLEYGKLSVKRRLQKYCASVNRWDFEEMIKLGIVEELNGGVYKLTNPDYYNNETGLTIENEIEYIL